MPCSTPLYLPERASCSAALACPRARSRVMVTTALYVGPSASRRSRKAFANSTGDTWRLRIKSPSSRIDRKTGLRVTRSPLLPERSEADQGGITVLELHRLKSRHRFHDRFYGSP